MSDGEFDRIQRLTTRFRGPVSPAVGIGDDAAVLPHIEASLVVTVDASVEGVHFRREWSSLDALAERAAHAAMSDLAAMGADPSRAGGGVLFALELPSSIDGAQFDRLIDGLARAAESVGAPVLGGNLTRSGSDAFSITTTAMGVAARPMLRSGARPGDFVFVIGPVGAARVGLEALLRDRATEPALAPFAERWLRARAQIKEGLAIASIASSAIDLSDGLAQDATHVASASGVAVVFDVERFPTANLQDEAARLLGLDPLDCALCGGEDYGLLFTAAPTVTPPFGVRVGFVREGRGVFALRDGVERSLEGGWDHFATRSAR